MYHTGKQKFGVKYSQKKLGAPKIEIGSSIGLQTI
jgi:hypothetical protein